MTGRIIGTGASIPELVWDNNKLAEVGTHDELIKLGGKYKELFDVQSQYYKEGSCKNEEEVFKNIKLKFILK